MDETLPFLFAIYPLLLTSAAFYWLMRSQHRSWASWTMRALACGSVVVFAFLAAPWAFTSYYLRYAALGLFAVFVGISYRRMKQRAFRAPAQSAGNLLFSALFLFLFTGLGSLAIASHYPLGQTLSLSFPLASGTYYVLQGGANIVTNPFHTLAGGKLALDIVKLNSFGNRASGIAPRVLDAYEIFGEKLYSPCSGSVMKVRNTLPDNPPGNPDTENPEGNYIVLSCVEGEVLMGHLKRGGIEVSQGESVTAGQLIANIGNSGNSLEPHLHIEARKNGAEVGLVFNGRALSANSLVTGR